MTFLNKFFQTDNDWSTFILRLSLGAMIFPHGAQKLLGWFGGYGFSGTMGFFTETMGIPWIFAFAAIMAEFFGGLGLLLGLGTRLWAIAVGATMAVAMLTSHIQHGFFMNWFGNQQGEGIEFFLLAIGLSIGIIFRGGGRLAIDALLKKQLNHAGPSSATS